MTDIKEFADALATPSKAWVFGDQVNTDDMFPGFAMGMSIKEASQHMFAASRPEWTEQVAPGDVVVAGEGFGIGSSRPVPLLFNERGVRYVVAEKFNTLFFRNCINYGLLPIVCEMATTHITDGDQLSLEIENWQLIINGEQSLAVRPLPEMLLDIVKEGGLLSRLERKGYLTPLSVEI